MKRHKADTREHKKHKVGTFRYVVFLSHSLFDKWIAEQMAQKIESHGMKTWLCEKDLEGGAVLVDAIVRGVDACNEAVVLISPYSAKSHWVMFEIGAVRGQHKRVTPILNNVNYDSIKTLKDVKAMDLNQFDDFLSQLKRRAREKGRSWA